jgi:hypothetical protein
MLGISSKCQGTWREFQYIEKMMTDNAMMEKTTRRQDGGNFSLRLYGESVVNGISYIDLFLA